MDTAAFLKESEEVDNKLWRKFSKRFFAEYRDTIVEYYGYQKQMYSTPPQMVNYPRFFVAVMMVLFESGIFGCNKKELADALYEAFCLGIERTTIRRWLYEMPPEYEEKLTSFVDSVNALKNKK